MALAGTPCHKLCARRLSPPYLESRKHSAARYVSDSTGKFGGSKHPATYMFGRCFPPLGKILLDVLFLMKGNSLPQILIALSDRLQATPSRFLDLLFASPGLARASAAQSHRPGQSGLPRTNGAQQS